LTATTVYARRFASLVKFEHTLFALPYAYVGAILARREIPSAHDLVWITAAMVGARSLAMALNRLIDAELDARNPRTAAREIPAGLLSRVQVAAFALASAALFVLAVWQLAPITHVLWPIPLAAFVLYPYTKRFTWLCHFVLGLSVAMAPLGGWVAVSNSVDWQPFLITAAVGLWVAGFDVIYATMDVEVDRRDGLHSLPERFGPGVALWVTRLCHLACVALLVWLGVDLGLGPLYFLGLAGVAVLLGYENAIVHPDDLSRVNTAFFTVNGMISILFLVGVAADALA
jgi:4-hydroxybenzoate polyprenyltransferase